MIEKNNDAKSTLDRDHLSRLYDVLEYAKNSDLSERKKLFRYAFSCVLARPAEESSLVEFGSLDTRSLDSRPFFDFLEAHTQGASAVAVITMFFRLFYEKGTHVVVHPLTESGASPKEVGDICRMHPQENGVGNEAALVDKSHKVGGSDCGAVGGRVFYA